MANGHEAFRVFSRGECLFVASWVVSKDPEVHLRYYALIASLEGQNVSKSCT